MLGIVGVTVMDERGATVNVPPTAMPVMGSVAVIAVAPGATAVTKPGVTAPLRTIVATAGFDEVQFALAVQS